METLNSDWLCSSSWLVKEKNHQDQESRHSKMSATLKVVEIYTHTLRKINHIIKHCCINSLRNVKWSNLFNI